MTGQKLLVANRGEIAIRIFRSAAALGMASIAIYPADDSTSLHVEKADAAIALPGRGVAAYLDGAAILRAAREAGGDGITHHPDTLSWEVDCYPGSSGYGASHFRGNPR